MYDSVSEAYMKSVPKSLRVPEDIAQTIDQIAEESRRDFSSVTNELLAEALKVRRCPGILFADGPSGRRARVAGTGLDVWEIVSTYRGVDSKWEQLAGAYHWLSPAQLRAALGYYAVYPDEIDRHVAINDSWTHDRLAKTYPALVNPRP